MTTPDTTPDTEVPPGEAPPRCPYCDRPFRSEDARALHVGESHPDRRTPAEAEEFERAREAEREELFVFHLKVVAALGALYALTVLAYMVVFSTGAL